MVEIVPALPEEAEALKIRQVAAIRRFLEAVATNRKAAGVSGLTGSVRETKTEQQTKKRAQGGGR